MLRSARARKAARTALYSLLLLLGLEAGMIVSPVDVLLRSRSRAMFLDGDILYTVPREVSWARAGGKVGWERICSYWGGGTMTVSSRFRSGGCSLFRAKPGGRHLF